MESKDSLEELKFSAEDIDIDVSLENSPDDFLEVSKKDAGCMTESFLDDSEPDSDFDFVIEDDYIHCIGVD